MKGDCCECGLNFPSESAATDPVLICGECLEDHRDHSIIFEIFMDVTRLDRDQLGHVREFLDHIRSVNRLPKFEAAGIPSSKI